FARAIGALPIDSARAARARDREAPRKEPERRGGPGHRGDGIAARHRARDRADSLLRGQRGGAGDRATRDSRAWWGLPRPSGGCDDPDRAEGRSGLSAPATSSVSRTRATAVLSGGGKSSPRVRMARARWRGTDV